MPFFDELFDLDPDQSGKEGVADFKPYLTFLDEKRAELGLYRRTEFLKSVSLLQRSQDGELEEKSQIQHEEDIFFQLGEFGFVLDRIEYQIRDLAEIPHNLQVRWALKILFFLSLAEKKRKEIYSLKPNTLEFLIRVSTNPKVFRVVF